VIRNIVVDAGVIQMTMSTWIYLFGLMVSFLSCFQQKVANRRENTVEIELDDVADVSPFHSPRHMAGTACLILAKFVQQSAYCSI
jgi:hypothetical protein